MFLRNRTHHRAVLARGYVSDELAIATVTVDAHYRIGPTGGLAQVTVAQVSRAAPEIGGVPLWLGTSVTAVGDAHGPERAPFVTAVELRVGEVARGALVFGDRAWRKAGSRLVPSEPLPFDCLDVSFARAFGGGYDEPPGVMPGSDLPHPGGRVTFPSNPGGIGLYCDSASAENRPLPNLERVDQRIVAWSDRPRPVAFAPCPDLPALRLDGIVTARPPSLLDVDPEPALRLAHFAPGDLIFDTLEPGASICLRGFGRQPLAFSVPSPPVSVQARRARATEIRPRLRAAHIDAESATVSLVWGFSGRYHSSTPPRWLDVAEAAMSRREVV